MYKMKYDFTLYQLQIDKIKRANICIIYMKNVLTFDCLKPNGSMVKKDEHKICS